MNSNDINRASFGHVTEYGFVGSAFIAVAIIKIIRSTDHAAEGAYELLLFSSPSALFAAGIVVLVNRLFPSTALRLALKRSLAVLAGALAYEAEQYWTDYTFDIADIVATLIGYCIGLLVIALSYQKTSTSPETGNLEQ